MPDVAITCPTHDRAGKVSSIATFGSELRLCVAESQADAYREAHPDNPVDTHPDDVKGLAPKRVWMSAHYGTVFMVDDDASPMLNLQNGQKVPPEVACDRVRHLVDTAEQFGAFMFGFNEDINPMHFYPGHPYRMSGEAGAGQWGLMAGHDLLPPPPDAHLAEDIWYSGVNAHKHRRVLVDQRFHIPMKVGQTGGVAGYRTRDRLFRCAEYLKETFGDAITIRPDATTYPWSFKVPW